MPKLIVASLQSTTVLCIISFLTFLSVLLLPFVSVIPLESMISNNNNSVANVVGAKTARACDSCIKRRARWYCAADDAFLCQSCDSSVHSANSLARRHERVRLKIASLKNLDLVSKKTNSVPSWHKGFTRKARTPRHNKSLLTQSKLEEAIRNPIPLVPEVGSDEASYEENFEEEQLLYRVPTFEPYVAELCASSTPISSNEAVATTTATTTPRNESKTSLTAGDGVVQDGDTLHGFLPSDMDLADFAANVESLLGKGLENESFGMEELGLVDCKEEKAFERDYSFGSTGKVKLEEEESLGKELKKEDTDDIDMAREPPFELSFDYESPATCGEEDEKVLCDGEKESKNNYADDDDDDAKMKRKKILLSLDYEAVMTAWASQGCSPWTTGERPDFDPDECWPDCMGACGVELHYPYRDTSGVGGHTAMGDGGREARVSRYREKRRTRLFSKKIRYEVRKLNAEKRPRMKGRFVKRATFAGGPALPLII